LPDVQQHRVEDVDAERTRVVCGKLLSAGILCQFC